MGNRISQIKTPDNSKYNISIPFIEGTGSTAGTWLGTLDGLTEYYDGLIILYKPSIKGASTTTLNLNSLGAKTCYINSSTKLTTHYPANQPILLVYSASQNSGCWEALDNYWTDADTYDRNRYKVAIKAGTAIVAGNIIVANNNLYHHLKDGTAFDIRNPILYANADIAASSTGTNNYDIINFTVTTTQSITLTAYAPVFIKGTLSGTTFTPDSTSPLTQTIPTSADSKYYMLLGVANTTTAIYLTLDHRIFAYKNGAFGEIVNDALSVNGFTVAKNVPSNAEFTDTQSDWNATSGKAVILNKPTIPTVNNGTLTIQKNGTQVATFTANQSGNSTANITVPTVTDTYSSTGTDATSGKAVAAALGTLDGTISGTASASKTLTAFSQTDGKVSATFGNISITKSQVSDFPSLGTAAAKNYTTSVTSGSSDLVTSGAVYSAIDNLPEPMVFKGTLGTSGTITTLPTAAASNEGYTYKVITAGTYASQTAKVGDVFVSAKPEGASAYSWILIPAGDTDSDTWRAIKVNGTQLLGSAISTGTVNFKNGSNVTVTGSGNDITIASTDEKVTSSANHYTPDTATGEDKTASASGATAAWSIDVVKGVTLNTDGKGHVTGISVTSGKIPANPNTDTKVRQTLTSGDADRPILLSHSGNTTTTTNVDNVSYRNNSIYANPSTGTITATNLVGNISGATGLTSTQVTTALGYTPPTQDTNTTYTFANGTNGFTVTPSGGTAQTVTVTPSITNNVTGSGTTGSFAKFTGAHTIGDATAAVDSATTGVSIADHSTTSITGVQSTTTTASKVTLGTAISVPNVTDAGSGSFTATVTNGVLSFSHVHTQPTIGTAISVPNVTAATDVTVPIKNTSSTTVVTSKTHTVTDNGHTHTLS